MYWFFTGLLIAAVAGTAGYTGYLLRRLFTTAPDAAAALTVSRAQPPSAEGDHAGTHADTDVTAPPHGPSPEESSG